METEQPEPSWEDLSADILTGMREWRLSHPKATLREIEQALDERFYRPPARPHAPRCRLTERCHRLAAG
jgi:hypothetical protein